jgi:tetratricopeptide (TPR) repeat protein
MASKKNRNSELGQAASPQASSWMPFLAGAAFLLIATLICYSRAIIAGYIWDDPQYVLTNQTLRTFAGLADIWLHPTSLPQWYPLVHTTFWIEYHLVGTRPMLYHIDNILLHAISGILLWRLLRKLEVPGAFFAACIFAVHPVMVESVAWITERKNCLSMVFYLLSMWVYLFKSGFGFRGSGFGEENDLYSPDTRNPRPETRFPNRFYFIALALFLAALFSKTVTASLPVAILLILWWKRGRMRLRDLTPLIPFFLLGAALGSYTGYLEKHHVGANGDTIQEFRLDVVQRCLIAGRAIWFYLGKLFCPHPLTFIYPRWDAIDHPTPVQWIYPAAVIAVTIALFFLRKKIGRGVLAAWLFFCVTLFPALGFVNVYPMRFSFVADHFQYHASSGIITLSAAGIGAFAHRTRRMRRAIYLAEFVVFLGLGSLTFAQCGIYKDAETLWRDTLSKNPHSWMVNTNLGNALAAEKKYDEAIPYHMHALALAPNLYDTHWNVGEAYMRENRPADALEEFNESLQINPQFAPAYMSLGELAFAQGDPSKAIENYNKALTIAPEYGDAHYYLAIALEQQANELKQKAQQSKNAEDAQAWMAKLNEVIGHYRIAVAANPDDRDAHYNLATCLIEIQQFDEAIWNLREAVRIDPTYVPAWTNLGSALYQSSHFPDAADAFRQALAIDPTFIPAQRGLAASKARMGG